MTQEDTFNSAPYWFTLGSDILKISSSAVRFGLKKQSLWFAESAVINKRLISRGYLRLFQFLH